MEALRTIKGQSAILSTSASRNECSILILLEYNALLLAPFIVLMSTFVVLSFDLCNYV
jgi:hypothetical protein